MNFAYIDAFDAQNVLASLMRPEPDPIPPVPCELSQEWIEFEKELGNFKEKYASAQVDLAVKVHELSDKREEINTLKMVLENVSSQGLKAKLAKMIEQQVSEEGVDALAQQCGVVKGRVAAMKKVLKDTNSERYARFTCFVCMDRHIDLFFDPCGHVICEPCWVRTVNKQTCPGCRTRLQGAKRIYTMTS
jgi:hypothetical protein